MALKTNYKDDVFTGNRKYKQTSNSDGSISLEDVTTYTQEGDIFAAKDINDTNTAVNANATSITNLTSKVSTNTSNISTNKSNIAANTSSINSLKSSKQDKAIKATITLGTSWSSLTQNVSVSGITANHNAILDVVTSTSNYEAQQTEWAKVYKAETYNGGIKFYAKEATSTALTIQVLAM